MYDDFVLGMGCLDNIYLGKLNKDKTMWLNKRDITNNFFQVVLERFNGCETEIVSSSGKRYLLTCQEIVDEDKIVEDENK
jgi:hypothetical protein